MSLFQDLDKTLNRSLKTVLFGAEPDRQIVSSQCHLSIAHLGNKPNNYSNKSAKNGLLIQ